MSFILAEFHSKDVGQDLTRLLKPDVGGGIVDARRKYLYIY